MTNRTFFAVGFVSLALSLLLAAELLFACPENCSCRRADDETEACHSEDELQLCDGQEEEVCGQLANCVFTILDPETETLCPNKEVNDFPKMCEENGNNETRCNEPNAQCWRRVKCKWVEAQGQVPEHCEVDTGGPWNSKTKPTTDDC